MIAVVVTLRGSGTESDPEPRFFRDRRHASASEPVHVQQVRRAAPVTVTVRYVLVEGDDGEALARRQATAIRYALTCLSRSDEPETPERSGRRDSGNEPNEDNDGADQR
jgi:hypothetical protein